MIIYTRPIADNLPIVAGRLPTNVYCYVHVCMCECLNSAIKLLS